MTEEEEGVGDGEVSLYCQGEGEVDAGGEEAVPEGEEVGEDVGVDVGMAEKSDVAGDGTDKVEQVDSDQGDEETMEPPQTARLKDRGEPENVDSNPNSAEDDGDPDSSKRDEREGGHGVIPV